jgi:hypothetical protein
MRAAGLHVHGLEPANPRQLRQTFRISPVRLVVARLQRQLGMPCHRHMTLVQAMIQKRCQGSRLQHHLHNLLAMAHKPAAQGLADHSPQHHAAQSHRLDQQRICASSFRSHPILHIRSSPTLPPMERHHGDSALPRGEWVHQLRGVTVINCHRNLSRFGGDCRSWWKMGTGVEECVLFSVGSKA